ncbi:MAG: efflux RND transporter periplasmic adaptor subunit [Bacteroidales bacterium]|nr:efflux RND transporter periplasmic adaptor subunit [Bacteroidales bacterium]
MEQEKKEQTQKVQAQVEEVVSQSVAAVEEANEPKKKSKKKNSEQPTARAEVKEQRTIARKRDKALLAALFVFTIVVAGIATLGMLLIQPPKDITQGQADCEQVRVSGKLPGRVVRFYVKEGDYVHKGDTLVSISSKTVDAALYKAQSAQRVAASTAQKVEKGTREEIKSGANSMVEQAKAAQEIAHKTYQRIENLYKEGVMTEQKRDEAKAAYDAATAAVAAAQSQARLAHNGAQQEDKAASQGMEDVARATVMEVQSLLEDQILVAPCDGEVSEIFPHEGELVALGTPIMTISKIQDMWVAFSVREEMLSKLPMDTVLTVTIPALDNKEAKMKVYYIHDMGSYAVWNATKAYGQYDSKTFTVKMRPMDHIEGFRPGMSVLLPE